MKPREFLYLIKDSFATLAEDIFSILLSLKKPATWSYLMLGSMILAVYYDKGFLLPYLFVGISIIKIIRDQKEGGYRRKLLKKDLFNNNDSDIVKEFYASYIKKQKIINMPALPFEDWKMERKKQFELEEKSFPL